MAKTDNLTDYLTDLADGIRAKKGTTEPINPQDFRKEIESISGGGESGGVKMRYIKTDGEIFKTSERVIAIALLGFEVRLWFNDNGVINTDVVTAVYWLGDKEVTEGVLNSIKAISIPIGASADTTDAIVDTLGCTEITRDVFYDNAYWESQDFE